MASLSSRSLGVRSVIVASLSAALIAQQILLTRIFSVVFLSHLGFAAISIGMLGLAAAGLRVYVASEDYAPENVDRDVARLSVYFALSSLICTFILTRLGADAASFSWSLFGQLALIYPIAALPFYFGGLALTLMLTHHREDFSRLYAADLVGASLGGIGALVLLPAFGGPGALVFTALSVSALGFLLCRIEHGKLRRTCLGMMAACTLLIAFDSSMGMFHVKSPKGHGGAVDHLYFEKWNAFSRVAIYALPQRPWSVGPNYRREFQFAPLIDIDSSAATSVASANDVDGAAYFSYELTTAGYTAAERGNALVIGAGGGRDVVSALVNGQKHVDAVEINPIIVNDIMRGEFADFSGHLYDDPRVTVHIGDGRSVVRRSTQLYDIIQLSLVDTWAATSAGAFALAENNLYTVEALKDYIGHLKSNGVLTFSRWSGPEIWRLLGELSRATRDLGMVDFPQHIALIETPGQGSSITNLIFRQSAFDAEKITALQKQIDFAGFKWLYNPTNSSQADRQYRTIIESAEPADVASQIENADLRPSTDDWPFFFYRPDQHFWRVLTTQPGQVFVKPQYLLVAMLMLSIVAATVCIVVPLARSSRITGLTQNWREAFNIAPYYAALGLGFMFVEVSLTQRFVLYLGHPTYALTVVLTSLLLGAGLGALCASRFEPFFVSVPTRIGWLAMVATVLLSASATLHPACFQLTQGWDFNLRAVTTLAMVAPVAAVLGALLPTAMACLRVGAPHLIPWAWGFNGFMSVVGSCAAALCAMSVGFTRTFEVGSFFYATAAAVAFAGGLNTRLSPAVTRHIKPLPRADHKAASTLSD